MLLFEMKDLGLLYFFFFPNQLQTPVSKAGLEGFSDTGLMQAVSLHREAMQVLSVVRARAVGVCVRPMCLRMVSLNKGTRILRREGIEQQFSRHPKCSLEKYALTAEEIISLGAQHCGELKLKALCGGPEEAAGMLRCWDTQPLEAWASDHNSR